MFGVDRHDIVANSVEEISSKSKSGVVGNKTFSYIFPQPMMGKSDNTTAIKIDHKDGLYFDINSVYRGVHLETLLNNRRLLATMIAISHYDKTIISWDSSKVAYNHKKNNNKHTALHIDYYGDEMERFQMLLNVHDDRTKLFYLPNSIDDDVKKLIEEITGKELYKADGFIPSDI